jgi:hypothetical protein
MMAAQCFVRSLSVDEKARHQRHRPCADGPATDPETQNPSNLLYLMPFLLNDKMFYQFSTKVPMKSHIVALSVALACTGAFAQSKAKNDSS